MVWRLALLLGIAARSWACQCAGTWPSVKDAWKNTPFIFLGTVERADPDQDGHQTIFQEQYVRIRVDEAFKGVSVGEKIELHQGANDCAAKFRTGQRFVFYLNHDGSGAWTAPACTRAAGSAKPGGDDLLFLRGLPKSAIGTRLSGDVELYEDSPSEAFHPAGGVPGVHVKISGARGFAQEAVTNAAGVYEVFGLGPGRYSVGIEVPAGLKVRFPLTTGSPRVPGDEAAVELASNSGASVDFVLQADTRLSGRVLDANGAPKKSVCFDLESPEGRSENGARFFNCSKTDGLFEMAMMTPGKYWLVARDDVSVEGIKSKSTLYYPGVRDRERATIISIEAGHYAEDLEVRLPSDEKRYQLSGRFQFSDGAPVELGVVTFTSPQHGYTETTSTGPNGSFVMTVVAGMTGLLNGRLGVFEPILRSCPEFKVGPQKSGLFRFMDASPIALAGDSNHEGLNLELSSPSCKSWPQRPK